MTSLPAIRVLVYTLIVTTCYHVTMMIIAWLHSAYLYRLSKKNKHCVVKMFGDGGGGGNQKRQREWEEGTKERGGQGERVKVREE